MNRTDKILQALVVFTVSVLSTSATLALAGNTVIEAKTIRIQSLSSEFQLNQLKAEYTYECTYKKGVFFPETESCGSKTFGVNVGADGTIELPALKGMGGFHGGKKGNYRFNLSVVRPIGDHKHEALFSLSGRGKEDLALWQNFNEVIHFVRIKGSFVQVTVERNPLIGSELAELPNANLMVVTRSTQDQKFQGLLLYSTFRGMIQSAENVVWSNGETPRRQLAELKQITIPDSVYAFTGSPADQKLELHAWLKANGETFESRVYGKLSSDFVKENAQPDLKKKVQTN
ncbi:MAG: hypothetical protein EOP09_02470 [Proteobacteria bacterium]|nr:MAG: hypothetical protein EOP09_02470 [Pseudomonadota bacterium]